MQGVYIVQRGCELTFLCGRETIFEFKSESRKQFLNLKSNLNINIF